MIASPTFLVFSWEVGPQIVEPPWESGLVKWEHFQAETSKFTTPSESKLKIPGSPRTIFRELSILLSDFVKIWAQQAKCCFRVFFVDTLCSCAGKFISVLCPPECAVMPETSADRNPLDKLAEEFVTRFRAGQRPSLSEYTDGHPELAEEIHDLFPALVEMEQLKPATTEYTSSFAPASEPSDPVRVGEFRILRRIGSGGMGVVYEAVQESLGRHVALKLLPADALLDPKKLERFRREARAAARLHHTNIVPVFWSWGSRWQALLCHAVHCRLPFG